MSFITVAVIGGSLAAAGGAAKLGMSLAGRKDRIAEQKAAKEEMDKRMQEYENLDTSNLYADVQNQYADMENVYEDLTVNQQQAQFEAQQGAQQRANIMQNLRGAAGTSGIAGLAQAMANQGQLATQRASASIGAQESKINILRAGEAGRLQEMERRGEAQAEEMRLAGAEQARNLQAAKTQTLLGMSQQRLGAANQARAEAQAQQMSAIGDIASGVGQIATAGMKMPGGGSGGNFDLSQASVSGDFSDPFDASIMSSAGNQFADSSTIFPTGGSTDYRYGFGNTPQINTPFPKKRKKK